MATQSVQPIQHISLKSVALGIAGAGLAVAAGFGVFALVDDGPVATTPGIPTDIEYVPPQPGSDAYEGWNRETRGLQHRR
ncbi:MAG TPA: hypothetical protein VFZ64_10290 [Nocardioidaceae bacterium]